MAATAPLWEEARIIAEQFEFVHDNFSIVGMFGIDEVVIFGGSEDRRHRQ